MSEEKPQAITVDKIWVSQHKQEDRPRRKVDAVVFQEMTSDMEDMVDKIQKWSKFKDSVEGYVTMKFSDAPSGKGDPDAPMLTVFEVEKFREDMIKEGQERLWLCTTDYFVDGCTVRTIEKGRRMRNGTAKRAILDCLNEFCIFAGRGNQFK
jgi:hypothetical protein